MVPCHQRIVTRLPLEELWNDNGPLAAVRSKALNVDDVRSLLRDGPISFVEANLGSNLRWVPESDCFVFWRNQVQPHLSDPCAHQALDQFRSEYCYFVSLWKSPDRARIVLVEKAH